MTLTTRIAAAHLAAILAVSSRTIGLNATDRPAVGVAGPLTITVNYTGQGTVDDTHRLWIWVFDTPDIGPGAMPILQASVSKNGASTTFADVTPEQVWIAVGYDQQGGSTGDGPPASGSPIGIYAGADGRPASVRTSDKADARVTFDDSMRMP